MLQPKNIILWLTTSPTTIVHIKLVIDVFPPGVTPVPCTGLQTVIPGKTKLPPSHQLPVRLQDFGLEEQRQEGGDEDV